MAAKTASTLNLLLRGGTVGVLLLVAGRVWRDQRGLLAARLGAACALIIPSQALVIVRSARPGHRATTWTRSPG